MVRVANCDEAEFLTILSRTKAGSDWWSSESVPKRISFQRFGMQLRDEDFQQEGTLYRNFMIRNRTAEKVATSGFSEFKNDDKEFRIQLDVWPFQHNEVVIEEVGKLYIKIKGDHSEKTEDNSECRREFTRYYFLPDNCGPMKMDYTNAILTLTFRKGRATEEVKPQKVLISLEKSEKGEHQMMQKMTGSNSMGIRNLEETDFNSGSDAKNASGKIGEDKPMSDKSLDTSIAKTVDKEAAGTEEVIISVAETRDGEDAHSQEVKPVAGDDSKASDNKASNTSDVVVPSNEKSKNSDPLLDSLNGSNDK